MNNIFISTLLLVLIGQTIYSPIATAIEKKDIFDNEQMTIEQQANEINRVQKEAYNLLEDNLKSTTEKNAISIVLDYLKKEPFVIEAGISEETVGRGMPTIWIIYKNGMEGGVTYRKPGYR